MRNNINICRYEREVNHGHRSAIKRILEGDALPSTMLVLCISAIHFVSFSPSEHKIYKDRDFSLVHT